MRFAQVLQIVRASPSDKFVKVQRRIDRFEMVVKQMLFVIIIDGYMLMKSSVMTQR